MMNKLELRKQCQTCQYFDWELHKTNSFFCAMHPNGQLDCPDYEVNLEMQKRLETDKKAKKRNQQISVIKLVILSLVIFSLIIISAEILKNLSSISPTVLASINISSINQIYLILSCLLIPYFLRELSREIKYFKSIFLLDEKIFESLFDILFLASVLLLLIIIIIIILLGIYQYINPVLSFIEASYFWCTIPLFLFPRLLMKLLLEIISY